MCSSCFFVNHAVSVTLLELVDHADPRIDTDLGWLIYGTSAGWQSVPDVADEQASTSRASLCEPCLDGCSSLYWEREQFVNSLKSIDNPPLFYRLFALRGCVLRDDRVAVEVCRAHKHNHPSPHLSPSQVRHPSPIAINFLHDP